MIFSVSSDGIQWTLDFGPVSVTIALSELDQNLTIQVTRSTPSCVAIAVISKARFSWIIICHECPVTENQEGTMEMRDEELSSVWSSRLGDTSSYQESDLEEHRVQLGKFAIGTWTQCFRPRHRHPFFLQLHLGGLSMEGSVDNPIELDEEEGQVECSSINTRVCHTHGNLPMLQRSRAFGAKMKNVPDYVFWKFCFIR